MSSTGAQREPHPNPSLIVLIGCMCGIVVALSQTLIIPLIPSLPTILHASADDASWAVTATLLTAAVATPIAGRLGDMFGKRLMLVISMGFLLAPIKLGNVIRNLIVRHVLIPWSPCARAKSPWKSRRRLCAMPPQPRYEHRVAAMTRAKPAARSPRLASWRG